MPVNRLLAEGKLDAALLVGIFGGVPVVEGNTPKNSLAPRSRDLSKIINATVCYIRDRDFDFFPPVNLTTPTIDNTTPGGNPLGWRWCRLEIENYLVEPVLVNASLGWPQPAFEAELIASANAIRYYQAARWTIGQSRKVLPPAKDFPTKPAGITHNFQVPANLGQPACQNWVNTQASTYLSSVDSIMQAGVIAAELASHENRFTTNFCSNLSDILLWFSGKDLLAQMILWLRATHNIHPTDFCARVRDWIVANRAAALAILPEWTGFHAAVQSYP